MFSLNQVTLYGNLGKEVKVHSYGEGKNLIKFSVATTESRKVNDEWVKDTQWFNVTLFNASEYMVRTAQSSKSVLVVGKLKTEKVEDGKGYWVSVIAEDVIFNGERASTEGGATEAVDEEFPF